MADGEFELVVDGEPTTLRFAAGRLRHEPGSAPAPELTVRTSSSFLDLWAAGEIDWDGGGATGDVIVDGPSEDVAAAWPRWLAATGYLLSIDSESASA